MTTTHAAAVGTPPGLDRPHKGKLRLDRGPLRWWLIVVGLLTIQFDWTRFLIGSGVVLVGALLHFVAKGCLRQNAKLTTSGPYRFTRNPFYVANIIAEVGLLVVIGNVWVAAAYLLAWAWIYHRTIRGEEQTLDRLFGDDHRRYCERVPRFLPLPWKVLPRDPSGAGGFSWRNSNIVQQRAAERTLRLMSYPLLLLCGAMLWRDGFASLVRPGSAAMLAGVAFLLVNLLGALSTHLLKRLSPTPLTPVTPPDAVAMASADGGRGGPNVTPVGSTV